MVNSLIVEARNRITSRTITLQLKPLVLCKQLGDLSIYRLFGREARLLISAFYQFLDLLLQNLGFRFRFFTFNYLVLIIHNSTLLQRVAEATRVRGIFP